MESQKRINVIIFTALACITGVFLLPAVAQDNAYHDFADKTLRFGIPNFGDVAGNALFVFMGLLGLCTAAGNRKNYQKPAYACWLIFFTGVFLTGFGSGYYHLSPDNETLVWDRLPMTLAFMSLTSLVVMTHISEKTGAVLLPVLLLAGVSSVWYWHHTETQGHGDLRFYALVQFLPMVLMLEILALFPRRDGGAKYLLCTLGFYIAAKLLEHFDAQVFALCRDIVSGHTLKHIVAASGIWWMIKYARLGALSPPPPGQPC